MIAWDCFIPLRSIRNDGHSERHCEEEERRRGNLTLNDRLHPTTSLAVAMTVCGGIAFPIFIGSGHFVRNGGKQGGVG
jgi:hypothetical protein